MRTLLFRSNFYETIVEHVEELVSYSISANVGKNIAEISFLYDRESIAT